MIINDLKQYSVDTSGGHRILAWLRWCVGTWRSQPWRRTAADMQQCGSWTGVEMPVHTWLVEAICTVTVPEDFRDTLSKLAEIFASYFDLWPNVEIVACFIFVTWTLFSMCSWERHHDLTRIRCPWVAVEEMGTTYDILGSIAYSICYVRSRPDCQWHRNVSGISRPSNGPDNFLFAIMKLYLAS